MKARTLSSLMLILLLLPTVATPYAVMSIGHDAPLKEERINEASNMVDQSFEVEIPVLEDTSVANGTMADDNFNDWGFTFAGTGYEGIWILGRTYLKFDLSFIPDGAGIKSATLHVYMYDEYDLYDEPMGTYYCSNNTWNPDLLTWNSQPTDAISLTASSVIDSPASPDMFVPPVWLVWNITDDVVSSLNDDRMLTEIIRQTQEVGAGSAFCYFVEQEYGGDLIPYLEIEYTLPETTGLTVDGISSGPLLDYIQDCEPTFGWVMSEDDVNDFQRDFELEVWNNTYYNQSLLYQVKHYLPTTIYTAGLSSNARPFGTADGMRFQFKYDSTQLSISGTVDQLHFHVEEESGTAIFQNFELLMVNCPIATDLGADFEANYGGGQAVKVMESPEYTAEAIDHVLTIDVPNVFFLSQNTYLIVEVRFSDNTGDLLYSYHGTSVPGSAAYTYGPGAESSTTANFVVDRTHNLNITFASDEIFYNAGSSGNSYPFNVLPGTPGWIQFKYNKSLFQQIGIVDKIVFRASTLNGDIVYENFSVYLVETPRLGYMSETQDENYGGEVPTLVLSRSMYTVRNHGFNLEIDVDNIFDYRGEHDLLIEIRWDALVSGSADTYRTMNAGGYRAWNLTWTSTPVWGNDTRTHDIYIDFIRPDTANKFEGCGTLENETRYYWRVRTCDSMGLWSEWATQSFKYEVLMSAPYFNSLSSSPVPAVAGSPVTISINVTYFLGMNGVWIEFGGTNHSMTPAGDIYSYTWTPASAGNIDYTIFMESAIGTWNQTSGVLSVEAPPITATTTTTTTTGLPPDMMMLLIAAAAAGLIIVIVLIVVLKRRNST